MSISPDRKALLFLATVAVLGASVRMVRAASRPHSAGPQPGLERQILAADSARSAKKTGSKTRRTKSSARRQHADTTARLRARLDVDTASAAQLDLLPGVGPSLAGRIVADRAAHGPFVSREGLARVRGVGPVLLARLDTLITFSGTIRPVTVSDESTFVGKSRRRKRP